MFQKISPRNNDWNRKYNFTGNNGFGFYIEEKNGISYFAWQFQDGTVKYYQCEQKVFEKNFSMLTQTSDQKLDKDQKIHFLRYPLEI